ncbi:hypothetical protein [Streptomyces lichenis]|uniref:SH3 domain-containing protein n=1 Tax=Streptomyces lichenis TaxID=2306967 RepID=A0ABT0I6V2_9ACTN|nr:hypothetical protein [Streptomyces lichenis]MCK8677022.1 hypothetical protein [Streptomyces lichenis]
MHLRHHWSTARTVAVTASTAAALLASPLAATTASAAPAADRMYRTWATNVNLRSNEGNPTACSSHPSTTNCPNVRQQVQPSHQLYVYCQKQGQTVGGNPYWVLVNDYTAPNTGWIASYYIDYPANRLPDVPDC